MRCERCGTELQPNTLFCTECGMRVATAPQPPVQDAPRMPGGEASGGQPRTMAQDQPAPVYQPAPSQGVPQASPQGPPHQALPSSPAQPAPPQTEGPPRYAQPQYRSPPRAPREPTIRNVHLGEVLLLLSSVLLLGAGFENLGLVQYRGVPALYIVLGIVAILVGLLFMGMVVMPHLLKGLANMLDMVAIGLSLAMLAWGLAAVFMADDLGWSGGFIAAGGLAAMVACLLRLGMIR